MVNQINTSVKPGQNLRIKDVKKVCDGRNSFFSSCGLAIPLFFPGPFYTSVTLHHLPFPSNNPPQPEIVTGEQSAEPDAEAVECPSCLGPGFERPCCGSFYCNTCYFRDGCCPGCGTQGVARGFDYEVVDPGRVPSACGWGIAHSFVASCLLVFILAVVNEGNRRVTVHGFKCYKWYSECDRSVCIHLNNSNPPRLTDNNDWAEGCDDRHDQNKVRGSVCVIDPELFRRSNHELGYDLCWGKKAKTSDTPHGGLHGQLEGGNVGNEADRPFGNEGKEFKNQGGKFTGGAYVFEDDFDAWEGTFNDRAPLTLPQTKYRSVFFLSSWERLFM